MERNIKNIKKKGFQMQNMGAGSRFTFPQSVEIISETVQMKGVPTDSMS
jgi:hypothetical protein